MGFQKLGAGPQERDYRRAIGYLGFRVQGQK